MKCQTQSGPEKIGERQGIQSEWRTSGTREGNVRRQTDPHDDHERRLYPRRPIIPTETVSNVKVVLGRQKLSTLPGEGDNGKHQVHPRRREGDVGRQVYPGKRRRTSIPHKQ